MNSNNGSTARGADAVRCDFSARQVHPTAEQVAHDDTDHWYVMVQIETKPGNSLSGMTLALELTDDSYDHASEMARLLDNRVSRLNTAMLDR